MFETYKCHKIVQAAKVLYEVCSDDVAVTFRMGRSDGSEFECTVTRKFIVKSNCQVGGYIVQYEDGYESWSPANAFEDGYVLQKPMTFAELCEKLAKYGFVLQYRLPYESSNTYELSIWLNDQDVGQSNYEVFGYRCGGVYAACQPIKDFYTEQDFDTILKACIRIMLDESDRLRSNVDLADILKHLDTVKMKTKQDQKAFETVARHLKSNYDKICKYSYTENGVCIASPQKLSSDLVYVITRRCAYEKARRLQGGLALTEPAMLGHKIEILKSSTNEKTDMIVTDPTGHRIYCSIVTKE